MEFKKFVEVEFSPGIWELFSKLRQGDASKIEDFERVLSTRYVRDRKRAEQLVELIRNGDQRWDELTSELKWLLNEFE